MVVLAVMAAGVHTMSIAAPALEEQERLARDAEAAAERAVVPGPAAADGVPAAALLGGVVLAFAVGLSAGHVHRRRRLARRSTEARSRPAPEPTPVVPARPAPPPPEPAPPPEPKPVEIAPPPAPPPPPPPVRSRGQRILRVRPAPPDPEAGPTTDEIMAEQVAEPPADEIAAPPAGPLATAPELPERGATSPPPEPPMPLGEAPEALRPPAAEEEIVALPARRFARPRPWPEEAETLWTCEIAWKAGYLKSTFRAMAGPPGDAKPRSIGESPSLRWTLMTDPEPPTPEMIASVKALVSALVEAGWERVGPGVAWYAQRFVWRGAGEPGTVAVPDVIEPAEPPSR